MDAGIDNAMPATRCMKVMNRKTLLAVSATTATAVIVFAVVFTQLQRAIPANTETGNEASDSENNPSSINVTLPSNYSSDQTVTPTSNIGVDDGNGTMPVNLSTTPGSGATSPCNTTEPGCLDVIFLLDGSKSIQEQNFNVVKEWVINQTMTIYQLFGTRAIVGVVQYSNRDPDFLGISVENSNKFVVPFTLAENVRDEDSVRSKISNMRYLAESTYTAFGLSRVAMVEFTRSQRYPEATRIVVVLTDGRADDAPELLDWWRTYGQTGEIIPFAVGVADYQLFDLRTIANGGHNDTRVFQWDSFETLHTLNIADEMADYVS